MRTLAEVMAAPGGAEFLAAGGIYTDQEEFRAQLRPPAAAPPATGPEPTLPVYSNQQVYIDYHWSVLHKILALRDLANDPAIRSFFLWIDTDRAGSDRLITAPAWPPGVGRTVAPEYMDQETRFVPLDRRLIERMLQQLQTQLDRAPAAPGMKRKYRALREVCRQDHGPTLVDFNYQVTEFLLRAGLDYVPAPQRLSTLLDAGPFVAQVERCLNAMPQFVAVFNATVRALEAQDVDPQVKLVEEDYLPLNYACDADNLRLRLHHVIDHGDHFAVAHCRCGAEYRFYLGRETLSPATLARTGRWSPNVCMPLFMTPLVSGLVAGKSGALYSLVLNAVQRQVLGAPPVPMYVPPALGDGVPDGQPDSLLYHYFYAGAA